MHCLVVQVTMCVRHRRHYDATRIHLDDARPVVYTALFDDSAGQVSTGSRRTRTCSPLAVRAQPGQRIIVTLRRSAYRLLIPRKIALPRRSLQ